jgi:molecular chaperone DnaK
MIWAKLEELKKASYKLAEEVYKNAGAQSQQNGRLEGPSLVPTARILWAGNLRPSSNGQSGHQKQTGKGNVEDVDYEVVDDDDKK